MIRRILLTGLALVALVAVVVGLSFISPLQRPETHVVQLPQTSRVTCVPAGGLLAVADSDLHTAEVGGAEGEGSDGFVSQDTDGPTVVRSDGDAAAGVLITSGARTWVPCEAPASSGMLFVADPSATELVLVNTDATEAAVDLTLYGPDGEISSVGARGIAIAPGVTRRVALSVLAADAGTDPVAVAFTSTPGRVAVLARAVEGSSEQHYATATTVAVEQVISGIPADGKNQKLLLSNPGVDRVDVTVQALGEAGTYSPASTADVTVPALSTVVVGLGSDLGSEATALRITSPGEVGAAVVLDDQPGPPVTLVSTEASATLASAARPGWMIQLSNPGVHTVTANVEGAEDAKIIVRAGMTVTVPVAEEMDRVRVTADGELVGAITSGTSNGLIVAPLLSVGVADEPGRDASYDTNLR